MKEWIEAMRLRTLPVSVAGVTAGTGCAVYHHGFSLIPMLICLAFAIIAQIASNFANEYYDFKNGLDKKGREGFRRGVTEGDISPSAMRNATFGLLAADIILGCSLIYWGGWWLIPVGAAIAVFALAYSAGPYPLSHHGLGDLAVVIFFGLVPVIFTEYVQTRVFHISSTTLCAALGVGLLAANVLIINNYRDRDDDAAVGKRTTVVIFGKKIMANVYLIDGITGCVLFAMASTYSPSWTAAGWIVIVGWHLLLWQRLKSLQGAMLNNILKFTSILLCIASIYLLVILSVWQEGAYQPDINPYPL
ncbi:MAG: 1,4-dihydroxy-2-naphthoate octaprenyltransferase [Muribaculaceae bacterium]|nr:1,4-dihydroxy-2-naphthoate octaprenyltransferase [Muribaculaceae bacterium]